MKLLTIPALAAGAVLLAACGSTTSSPTVTVTASSSASAVAPSASASVSDPVLPSADESSSEAASSELGSMENPYPIGSTASVGDWEVTITGVEPNAVKAVLETNQFNEKPAKGETFVLWGVRAKYVGEGSQEPMFDLSWKVLGPAGNTFDESCGVIPQPFDEAGETFKGGTAKGLLCVRMPKDQVDGGKIIVEQSLTMDDTRAFFSLS